MRTAIIILSLCLVSLPFGASASVITAPADQHSVMHVERPQTGQEFFGKLTAFPHTYSFSLHETTRFAAHVYMYASGGAKNDATMLLVKEERKGVSEIGRTDGKDAQWQETRDAILSMDFNDGGSIDTTLEAGSYRLEVSSPDNDALYRLVLNDGASASYFSALSTLFAVNTLVGAPAYTAFSSPLVYVPLLVLLAGGIAWHMKRRRKFEV